MADTKRSSNTASWSRRILGFLIGLFGAAAILGVFFKIIKWDHYEIFMVVGFIGEAAAFVVMGLLELFSPSSEKGEAPEKAPDAAPVDTVAREAADEVVAELTTTMHRMVEEQVNENLSRMMLALARTTKQFSSDMHALGNEMQEARQTIEEMRGELEHVVTDELERDAEALGHGMRQLSSSVASTGALVETMQADLERMSRHFSGFNHPPSPTTDPSSVNGRTHQ